MVLDQPDVAVADIGGFVFSREEPCAASTAHPGQSGASNVQPASIAGWRSALTIVARLLGASSFSSRG